MTDEKDAAKKRKGEKKETLESFSREETGKRAAIPPEHASWKNKGFNTRAIRAGEDPYPETPHSLRTPLYATKSYTYKTHSEMFENHYYYSRTENPTLYALDQKLADLHRGEAAVSVASGMGAVNCACLSVLQQRVERVSRKKLANLYPSGEFTDLPHMIVHNNQYTGSARLFTKIYPQMGIHAERVNCLDLQVVQAAITPNTKLIFVESPANPNADILDIEGLAKVIHEAGGKLVVDNTWASPALQRPIELGADLVVESLTKYICGHGDAMGGAVIGPYNHIKDIRYYWLECLGPVLSPFNAWLILRGIRTLGLRMDRHGSNALAVAEFLDKHPKVEKAIYPGLPSHPGHTLAKRQMKNFGGMLGFELKTMDDAQKFGDALELIKVGVSLGDTTSLIEWTMMTTGVDLSPKERRVMGITDTHFRFSVGLEDPQDLIADLDRALSTL